MNNIKMLTLKPPRILVPFVQHNVTKIILQYILCGWKNIWYSSETILEWYWNYVTVDGMVLEWFLTKVILLEKSGNAMLLWNTGTKYAILHLNQTGVVLAGAQAAEEQIYHFGVLLTLVLEMSLVSWSICQMYVSSWTKG